MNAKYSVIRVKQGEIKTSEKTSINLARVEKSVKNNQIYVKIDSEMHVNEMGKRKFARKESRKKEKKNTKR